jgi:hypothetical protein
MESPLRQDLGIDAGGFFLLRFCEENTGKSCKNQKIL